MYVQNRINALCTMHETDFIAPQVSQSLGGTASAPPESYYCPTMSTIKRKTIVAFAFKTKHAENCQTFVCSSFLTIPSVQLASRLTLTSRLGQLDITLYSSDG